MELISPLSAAIPKPAENFHQTLTSFQRQILELFKSTGAVNSFSLERYFLALWQQHDYFLNIEKLEKVLQEKLKQRREVFAEIIKKYRLLARKFLLSLGQSGVHSKIQLLPGADVRMQMELGNVQYQLGWENIKTDLSAKKVRPALLRRQQQLAKQMQKMLQIVKQLQALVQTKVSPGLNQDLLLAFVEKLADGLKEISEQFNQLLNKTAQSQEADPIEMTLLALVAIDLKNLKPQAMKISYLLKKYLKEGSIGFADFVSSPADRQTIERLAQDLM
jgi:hypothetical protein